MKFHLVCRVQIGNLGHKGFQSALLTTTMAFISLTFGIMPDFPLGLLIINSTGVYKPVVICFDFIVSFHELWISLKSDFLKVQEGTEVAGRSEATRGHAILLCLHLSGLINGFRLEGV